jgi:phenylacetate-CoA ligase
MGDLMIWDPKAECASRDDLRRFQNTRFEIMLGRIRRSAFYQERFSDSGIDPGKVRLEDLPGLCFTTKDDLRQGYPYGLLACSVSELVEVHASSGTTGKPAVVGYTRGDIELWGTAMARTLTAAGATRADVLQNAFGYGLFTGGLGFHYGGIEIGATVIPVSGGRTDLQMRIAEDLGSTILSCTPSFALYLATEAEQLGRSLKKTCLRIGVFGAEPWSEDMRGKIETSAGIVAYDAYGLSEIIGPGVAFECSERNGMHVNEDLFFPEVINPETGEALAEGTSGELVLTSVAREGMPLLRYRTRDLTSLSSEPCACGRTFRKMKRIKGRADDMLIIAGVNFYPSQVESLILAVPGTSGHYQIRLWTEDVRDHIEVVIEPDDNLDDASTESIAGHVAARLRDNIGIRMLVKTVPPGTLERSQGKARRVFDSRSQKC